MGRVRRRVLHVAAGGRDQPALGLHQLALRRVRGTAPCLLLITGQVAVTRGLSPPFGKLQSVKLSLEQALRNAFFNLTTHCEVGPSLLPLTAKAIAAFSGARRELEIVAERARALWKHGRSVMFTQWWYGIVEDVCIAPALR